MDPMNANGPLEPGTKSDFITIQRLLPGSPTRAYSHVLYLHYNRWVAEFNCVYDEHRDRMGDCFVRRTNRNLRQSLASPIELRSVLEEQLPPEHVRDPQTFGIYMQRGPIDVRLMREEDDEGNRFLQIVLLCTGLVDGPYLIKLIAKRWDIDRTEEEETLTDDERMRLGISDQDWVSFSGEFIDAMEVDVSNANANTNGN